MSSIVSTAYTTNNLYYYPNEKTTDLPRETARTSSDNEAASTTRTGDTVTLSADVSTAKTREAMGLAPTGILKLADFETAAAAQEKTVKSLLESAMEDLGIDPDQKVSLSLDADNNIVIKENFSGKSKLESTLNDDGAFELAFKGLKANSEIVNYAGSLRTRSITLADYFNSDTSQDDLYSLAAKYAEIKSSPKSLETLMGISNRETPYTFVHNSDEQAG